MSPGASPAAVTFESDAVLSESNTLLIELGGTASGTEFDTLALGGTATLGGTLEVAPLGDFMPTVGESFEIVSTSGGVSGEFAMTLVEAFDPLLNVGVFYGSNAVTLAVVLALPGDYNTDGVVDAADYTVWRDALGSTANFVADGDQSGTVDEGDYTVWKDNFGNTVLSGVGNNLPSAVHDPPLSLVPEPGSLVVLLSTALLTLGQRRCSRRQRRAP